MREVQHASKQVPHAAEIPNLIEIQLDSYRWFLEEGLPELFRSFSPITDFTGNTSIALTDYTLGQPKYSIEQCRDRDMTFESPIYVRVEVRQPNKEMAETEVYLGDLPLMTDKGTFIINGAERVVVSQLARSPGVYFEENLSYSGRMLYKARIIPSEGAWVEIETDTQHEDVLNVQIGQARKFPLTTLLRALNAFDHAREPLKLTIKAVRERMWLYRTEGDGEARQSVRDRIMPLTLAEPVVDRKTGEVVGPEGARIVDTQAEADALNAPSAPFVTDETPDDVAVEAPPAPADGAEEWVALETLQARVGGDYVLHLSAPSSDTDDIVKLFGKRVTLRRYEDSELAAHEQAARDAQAADQAKAETIDQATGETADETQPTAEGEAPARKLPPDALAIENMLGNRLAADVVDPKTGKILVRAMHRLDKTAAAAILKHNVPEIEIYDVHRYIKATLEQEGQVSDAQSALIDIYKKLRPGDPVTPDSARSLFQSNLFDPRRYDLGRVGRYKMSKKLELGEERRAEARDTAGGGRGRRSRTEHEEPLTSRTLTREDVAQIVRYLINLDAGHGTTDDIDHLENKRVRSVGELLQSQLRLGFLRMEKVAKERMTALGNEETVNPTVTLSVKPVSAAIKSFFGSSQLSQFMDQTNPLAELTSKRRLSALGPGGLSRQSAKLEVRDVHHSHYGRICPIETPEGPNIGLIGSMAVHARVDGHGFLQTPYRRVRRGRVTNEIVWMNADEDHRYHIAPGNERTDAEGRFTDALGRPKDEIQVRHEDQYPLVRPEKVDFMDVSPMQIVSVATAMIPFLENDDANRALMGSNMQRQAVPTLRPSAAIVKTGVEKRAARDSRAVVTARRPGTVASVTSREIIIQTPQGERDRYRLINMLRSNQSTCITQRPIVRVGQRVRRDEVIADGPCTDGGELALGQNVLVAFMPWGGYNYEDAILISERLVKDDVFTSIHIEKYEKEARDTKLGPEEITRDIPNVSEDMLKDLDENGIIRIGAEVRPEDILVGEVAPKGQGELTAEERLIIAIFGKKAEETRDVSLRVPHGEKGKVVDVKVFSRFKYLCERCSREYNFSKRPDLTTCDRCDGELVRKTPDELNPGVNQLVRVYIAQKRKIMEGDKMAGRHGNKGVISKILPEEDMPFLPDGTPVDIVLNPLGVPSRMNIGQILETHLGLAGHHLGCSFVNPAFEGSTEPDIRCELEFTASHLRRQKLEEYVRGELGLDVDFAPDPEYDELRRRFESETPDDRLDRVSEVLREASEARLNALEQVLRGLDAVELERVSAIVGGPVVSAELADAAQGMLTFTDDGEVYEAPKAAVIETVAPPADYDYRALVDRIRDNAWARAGIDPATGKSLLRDGLTGTTFDSPVTVGYLYMMKLAHLVDDKIHARSTGPYSLVTQQPLGGKAQFGGQRFGEMEVWALEAYGSAYTLQEILTIKSDDVQGRVKTYEAIVKGDTMLEPGVPESFKILMNELQSLCLKVVVEDENDNEIDLKDKDDDINPNEDPVNATARRRARQRLSSAAFSDEE
ncbi:MAG: DNA-directed RNA polymerase subunit beta [Chthonomonadales bacterium]|nr:DNA-directed RNA polymerase subunit beta [Chthonomonadales bacterium]